MIRELAEDLTAADNPHQTRRMGQNARRRRLEHYSRAACTAAYERLLVGQ